MLDKFTMWLYQNDQLAAVVNQNGIVQFLAAIAIGCAMAVFLMAAGARNWKPRVQAFLAVMVLYALLVVAAKMLAVPFAIKHAQDIREISQDGSACMRIVDESERTNALELVVTRPDTVVVFGEPRVIRQAAAKRVEIPLSLADTIDALLQREGLSMARLPMCDADVYTWRTPTEVRHSDFGGAS